MPDSNNGMGNDFAYVLRDLRYANYGRRMVREGKVLETQVRRLAWPEIHRTGHSKVPRNHTPNSCLKTDDNLLQRNDGPGLLPRAAAEVFRLTPVQEIQDGQLEPCDALFFSDGVGPRPTQNQG